MITFTVDLEDPTERYEPDGRYVIMTRQLLKLCDKMQRRATFFVVGRVAQAAPRLLQEIASQGHEVAYHSHNHLPLTEENPARFRRESAEDKDRFEQLTGYALLGFRAPRFSLTPQSIWAVKVLGDLGFRYSSSIMPTNLSLFGFPHASRVPSLWPNGLIELPLPVADLAGLRIPYLGGIYLYVLPEWLTRHWIAKADKKELLWTYTHPYDFDSEDKFKPMPHTPRWVSLILGASRYVAEDKVRKILKGSAAPPLCERIAAHITDI